MASYIRALFNRDVIVVLMVALAARLLFMLAMPPAARSSDAYAWETVAKVLATGANPYQTTGFLSWPPFWLQLIFVISKISKALSVPFFRVLQVFLILVESAVIVLLIRLIREIVPAARVRMLVIIGIALNPAAILLICQHCNFDVLVAFWLMLFMLSLLRYNRTKDYADWLCACLFLGLGILTKTVPLVLIPLLAGGFRWATTRVKFLGLVALLGPTALGISIIYVLAPADITAKVFEYRSQSGAFGFSGLLQFAGADNLTGFYNLIFYVLLCFVMISAMVLFWRRQSVGNRETVLLAALLLVGVPVLGPGYASQYLYWFMPFLVATFAFFKGEWRLVMLGFALIAVCTDLFEYALLGSHGNFVLNILVHEKENLRQWSPLLLLGTEYGSSTGATLLRLPLFVAYLVLLTVGTGVFLRGITERIAPADGRTNRVLKRGHWLVISAALVIAVGLLIKEKPAPAPKSRGASVQVYIKKLLVEAAKGDPAAEYKLGRAYQFGFGVAQDLARATDWYQRAAEQGHLDSQNALGSLLAAYRQDYTGAAQWFTRAATNGSANAQYNLGVLYHKGLGVSQNDELAAQWVQKSAGQGYAEAERVLGGLYQSGRGVKQDYIAAYKWLKLAQLQGDKEASNELKTCSILMTSEQIAAAEKLVQEFKASKK